MESYLYEDLYQLEEQHWWHRAKRAVVLEVLHQYLPQTKRSQLKHKLLDIGCGTGKNVEAFQAVTEAYGVDVSVEALNFCKQRGLRTVSLAEAEELPFTDQYFDVITMLDVLEHIDEQTALKEVSRVLKPGGLLIVTVPAFQWLWSEWDVVLHHKKRYTKAELQDAVTKQGFRQLKSSYLYSFLVLPVLIIRKIKSAITQEQTQYQSDFKLSSPMVNSLLERISSWERRVFWRFGLPLGTSVVGVFRKEKL